VLSDFSTERILFPWLPKLLAGAGALSWNLGAFRSAERLTQMALRYDPMSVNILHQLVGIWKQIKDRNSTTIDTAVAKKESSSSSTTSDDPIEQVAQHASFLTNNSGYVVS
tara:strand:+ start:127 stop:459 length:333 start_codon:yes stop_codon:yes gene_type:complete